MNDWIQWCSCGRRILTSRQQDENKPCAECQQEHSDKFKDRFDELVSKEDFDG